MLTFPTGNLAMQIWLSWKHSRDRNGPEFLTSQGLSRLGSIPYNYLSMFSAVTTTPPRPINEYFLLLSQMKDRSSQYVPRIEDSASQVYIQSLQPHLGWSSGPNVQCFRLSTHGSFQLRWRWHKCLDSSKKLIYPIYLVKIIDPNILYECLILPKWKYLHNLNGLQLLIWT